MPIQFDTLDYTNKLLAAGVPDQQAEAHAKALGEVLGKSMVVPADLLAMERHIIAKIEAGELKYENKLLMLERKFDAKFEAIDRRFEAIERHIDSLEQKFDVKLIKLGNEVDAKLMAMENRIDAKLAALELKLTHQLLIQAGDIYLLKWMMATLIASHIAILLKLFLP